jgi:hypothetical protein
VRVSDASFGICNRDMGAGFGCGFQFRFIEYTRKPTAVSDFAVGIPPGVFVFQHFVIPGNPYQIPHMFYGTPPPPKSPFRFPAF